MAIFQGKMSKSAYCSPANSPPWAHKSLATVMALPEAKDITGRVADTHSNFIGPINSFWRKALRNYGI